MRSGRSGGIGRAGLSGRRAWTGLVVVFIALATFGVTFQFVPPLLPQFIDQLGLTHGQAGLLMALFALPGILLSLPGGLLVDRFGVRSIGTAGLGTMVLGTAMMALPGGFGSLLGGRIVAGTGAMVAVVSLQRTVTRLFEGRSLGLPLGIVNTGIPCGIVVALNGSGIVAEACGWRTVVLATCAVGAGGCLLFWLMTTRFLTVAPEAEHRPKPEPGPRSGSTADSPAGAGQSDAVIWMAGLTWLCSAGAMTAFVTFAPDHYRDLGLGAASRGFFVSLPMWIAAALGPAVGWLTDRKGGKGAIIATGMLLVSFFLALVPGGLLSPLLIGVCLGLALSCIPTPLLSLPVDVTAPARHGRAFGILSTGANAGVFLVPPVAGAVRDASGHYGPAFLLMAAIAYFGMMAALRLSVGRLPGNIRWLYVFLLPAALLAVAALR